MPIGSNEFGCVADIVISGISGTFPKSKNMAEFKKKLFSGEDLFSSAEKCGHEREESRRIGAMENIDRFDTSFFNIDHKQAEGMATSARLLLEKTFEAIMDAGYNPRQMKGNNIAVVCGQCNSYMNEDRITEDNKTLAKSKIQLANIISHWFDFCGPSITLDTACSSSTFAVDYASKAIQLGDCDAAVVCSVNLCILPADDYFEMGVLSPDGICRPFDADGNGFVRGEASVAVLLQKRNQARRIYAHLVNSRTNCDGFKPEGITCPSIKMQKELYKRCYEDINIDPLSVSYIEAHGTATQVGDPIEGTSIEEFFCIDRTIPLKIGSVKSNMGHGEGVAGLCSIAKMIIAFEEGKIPANLNYQKPNPKIKGLLNGHIEVVTKSTPLLGEHFAINSFGVGGANGHVLLSPHDKIKKTYELLHNDLPRLVTVCGRTEEAVDRLLNDLEENHEDVEYIRLIHEIFSENINGYHHRGHLILNADGNHVKSKTFSDNEKRPLWFVFSGMGSQRSTIGKSLMKVPIFAKSILRSHDVLLPKGVNLTEIITSGDPQIMKNVLNSFVGIAAIQIALADVLQELHIKPDGMIGHSVGELGCAYADGCLTAEQTILAAYYRGLVSLEAEFMHITTVTADSGYQAMRDLVPPEIDIICYNSQYSCTISGPTDIVQEFSRILNDKNISWQEVNTSNIAYHSRYIGNVASKFTSYMKEIITEPKLRSEKWLSTSAMEHEWDTNDVKYCSPEYLTNNLLNPVYFEETCRHVPNNAIVIEIAPHAFLNGFLASALTPSVEYIKLTTDDPRNEIFFLRALSQLYEAGYALKLDTLYPLIQFPVSRSTPMISPLIKWQHDQKWPVGENEAEDTLSIVRDISINPKSRIFEYITGHIIDERNLYPGLGYVVSTHLEKIANGYKYDLSATLEHFCNSPLKKGLVWETIHVMLRKKKNSVPVVFENVRFERATNVPKKGSVKFHVTVHLGRKFFEITESGALVAFGNVRIPQNISQEKFQLEPYEDEISTSEVLPLTTNDFYKELRLRGYHYKGIFKKVVYANAAGTYGKVSWCNNMVSFMDTMAQISALHADCRELLVPIFIRKLVIDIDEHNKITQTLDKEKPELLVNFYPSLGLICSGGVQMSGFKTNEITRKPDKADPVLETHQFIPYSSNEEMSLNLAIRLCVHIALENTPSLQVKTYEILDHEYDGKVPLISNAVAETLADLPLIRANINVLTTAEKSTEVETPQGINILNEPLPEDESSLLIILSNIRRKSEIFEKVIKTLKEDGYIITRESLDEKNSFQDLGYNVCFSRRINENEKILLLSKIIKPPNKLTAIKVQNDSYSWISEVQTAMQNINAEDEKLIIYAEKESISGILGFFNCLRKEKKGTATRCFLVMDEKASPFSLKDSFYKSQFDKNLSQNVYKNKQWGSYRHLPLEPVNEIEVIHAFCTPEKRADLSSFRWLEDSLCPSTYEIYNGVSLGYVYYSSLNFRDVMLSIGKISRTHYPNYCRLNEGFQGTEFSGKDENGRRIMGIPGFKSIATLVKVHPLLTWDVPDHITLEEAASIPVVYSTVIVALIFRMKLKRGDSILIHAGTGGIGQAAINICLHYECNIFTSVGTPEKVEFIKKTYPQIPEHHICNSRDTSFEKVIMEQTNGKGVDVVLNSLAGDKLKASLRCVAKGGHFLEIGKFDMARNNDMELSPFLNDITFYSIQLDCVVLTHNDIIFKLKDKLQEMLNQGIVKPIQTTVFQVDEVETAIRYMAAGKHMGKVVIKIRDEEKDLKAKPVLIHMKAKPRVLCKNETSFVIVGGLGGFGLELVDWLILRGARNIVLSSRTGIKNGYQSYRIKLWRSYGVNVVISTEDVTTESGVYNLLQTANNLGPIAGIFNVALILKDDPFPKQNEETFSTVAGPKAIATVHLDKLSRTLCPHLEHFVVFSSVACGRGNLNQTNYGFSNSIMERICESRKVDNLPALAIQWGAIGEVGVVADFAGDNLSIVIGGTLPQNVRSCLNTLNSLMKQSYPVVSSMIVAETRHGDSDVVSVIANILGIKDIKTISLTWTLPELGMDSILAVEINRVLESEFNTFFMPDVLQKMTFAKLYQMKAEKGNTLKTEITKSEYQKLMMDTQKLKEPLLRIPFDNGKINEILPVDKNPTLFVLPGVEGMATLMEPLAKNLPIQTLCFQYYENHFPLLSFTEISKYFANFVLEKLAADQLFCIVGYSLGGSFALDLVRILEQKNRKGYLWLIDTSPSFSMKNVTQHFEKDASLNKDENLQNYICIQLLKLCFSEVAKEENFKYIEKANGWESKKEIVSSTASRFSINKEIINQILDRNYAFIKLIQNFEFPRAVLESPCVLIRTVENLYGLDESYGLQKYFKNPVQVHQIEANHYTILNNHKTAEIIMEGEIWKRN